MSLVPGDSAPDKSEHATDKPVSDHAVDSEEEEMEEMEDFQEDQEGSEMDEEADDEKEEKDSKMEVEKADDLKEELKKEVNDNADVKVDDVNKTLNTTTQELPNTSNMTIDSILEYLQKQRSQIILEYQHFALDYFKNHPDEFKDIPDAEKQIALQKAVLAKDPSFQQRISQNQIQISSILVAKQHNNAGSTLLQSAKSAISRTTSSSKSKFTAAKQGRRDGERYYDDELGSSQLESGESEGTSEEEESEETTEESETGIDESDLPDEEDDLTLDLESRKAGKDTVKTSKKVKIIPDVKVIKKGTKTRPSKKGELEDKEKDEEILGDIGEDIDEEIEEKKLLQRRKRAASAKGIFADDLWMDEPLSIPDGPPSEKIVDKILHWKSAKKREPSFFVLYKDMSYLQAEWISQSDLESTAAGKIRYQRYMKLEPKEYDGISDLFDACFLEVDRILAARGSDDDQNENSTDSLYYLVKWNRLSYSESTWEKASNIKDDEKIQEFAAINDIPDDAFDIKTRPCATTFEKMTESPKYKKENSLRPWQIDGVNWLTFCWYQNRGVILADEMGLGKTVQTVATVQKIREVYSRGPFLVVVPLSTIMHWKREFESWTDINVIVYQGTQNDRNIIRHFEFRFWNENGEEVKGIYKFEVLLTTYEALMTDFGALGAIPFKAIIVDEAHRMKNKSSRLFRTLQTFPTEWRMILTGTPIQNNIEELWTLLHFVDRTNFSDLDDFLEKFGNMQNNSEVLILQELLRPYMLRRIKEDVAKYIPPKEETIVEVELTIIQKQYYRAVLERNQDFLYRGLKSAAQPKLLNLVMQLRKICNHPYLISGAYDRLVDGLPESEHLQRLIESSGKLVLVDKLLPKLKKDGHKVLIFSQMKAVLDLLQEYCQLREYNYERIDGGVRGNERQNAIDRFCKPDSDGFVFLLCTRAGGIGINLAAADTVLIYDSDWNPQQDIQAQARCHRIGQTKEVKVYRLITANTYEKKMFMRASMKLGLDQAVLHNMRSNGEENDEMSTLKKISKKEIDDLLKYGAYDIFKDGDDTAATTFVQQDIDEILAKRTTIWSTGTNEPTEASTFSKASFLADKNSAGVDFNDPNFWDLVLPKVEKSAASFLARLESDVLFIGDEDRKTFFTDLEKLVDSVVIARGNGETSSDMETTIAILHGLTLRSDVYEKEKDQARDWIETIENPKRSRKVVELSSIDLVYFVYHLVARLKEISANEAASKSNKNSKAAVPIEEIYLGLSSDPNFDPNTNTSILEESEGFRNKNCNGLGGIAFGKGERDKLEDSIVQVAGTCRQLYSSDANVSMWESIRKVSGLDYRPLAEIIAFTCAFFNLCHHIINTDSFRRNKLDYAAQGDLDIFKLSKEKMVSLLSPPFPDSFYVSEVKRLKRTSAVAMAYMRKCKRKKARDFSDDSDEDESGDDDDEGEDDNEDNEENLEVSEVKGENLDSVENSANAASVENTATASSEAVVKSEQMDLEESGYENYNLDPKRCKDVLTADVSDFSALIDEAYQRKLRNSLKKIHRLFVQHKMIADEIHRVGGESAALAGIFDNVNFPAELTAWWTRKMDCALLVGSYRHGSGCFDQIREDSDFPFQSLLREATLKRTNALLAVKNSVSSVSNSSVTPGTVKALKQSRDSITDLIQELKDATDVKKKQIEMVVEFLDKTKEYYANKEMPEIKKMECLKAETALIELQAVVSKNVTEISSKSEVLSKLPNIESLEAQLKQKNKKKLGCGPAPNCICDHPEKDDQFIMSCLLCFEIYHFACIFNGSNRVRDREKAASTWICSSCDIKWPSNRVLEGRVRAIVEAVEKAQVFSQKAPTKRETNAISLKEKEVVKSNTITIGNPWIKKEKADFYRFVCASGRPKSFVSVQMKSGLSNKTNEQLEEYFHKLVVQSYWIRSMNDPDFSNPFINPDRATLLKRYTSKKDALESDIKFIQWDLKRPHHSWLIQAGSNRLCGCQRIAGSRPMLCCEKCHSWVHGECVGLTSSAFDKLYSSITNQKKSKRVFMCPDCHANKNPITMPTVTSKYAPSGTRRPVTDFSPMSKALGDIMIKTINSLYSKYPDCREIFGSPVDPISLGIPDYWTVVLHPMDLGTIIQNVKNNCYSSLWQPLEDCRLVFRNCLTYNVRTSDIAKVALKMQAAFEATILTAIPLEDRTFSSDLLALECGSFVSSYRITPPSEIKNWIACNLATYVKVASNPALVPLHDVRVTEADIGDNSGDTFNISMEKLNQSAFESTPYCTVRQLPPASASSVSTVVYDRPALIGSINHVDVNLLDELNRLNLSLEKCCKVVDLLNNSSLSDLEILSEMDVYSEKMERSDSGILLVNNGIDSLFGFSITSETPEIVDEGLTINCALKLIERVELNDAISNAIKMGDKFFTNGSPLLGSILPKSIRRAEYKMPEWWESAIHDQAMLKGIGAYGMVDMDLVPKDLILKPVWFSNGHSSEREQFLASYFVDRQNIQRRLQCICDFILGVGTDESLEDVKLDVSKSASKTSAKKMKKENEESQSTKKRKNGELAGRNSKAASAQSSSKKRRITETIVERDESGDIVFPITLKNGVILHKLGEIDKRESFHSQKYIWPVGFCSTRSFPSVENFVIPDDPTVPIIEHEVTYTSYILDDGMGHPWFSVQADDMEEAIVASSATTAWSEIYQKLGQNRGKVSEKVRGLSGPDLFGYGDPVIRALIEQLPGANQYCNKYFNPEPKKSSKNQKSKQEDDEVVVRKLSKRQEAINRKSLNVSREDSEDLVATVPSPSFEEPDSEMEEVENDDDL